jgi:ATP-binding cassette subfamily B protein
MLVSGLLPVAFTVTTGLVIGAIPDAVRDGLGSPAGGTLVRSLVVLGSVYAASTAASNILAAATSALGFRFALAMRTDVLETTLGPAGVAHLEDPSVADELRLVGSDEQINFAEWVIDDLITLGISKISGLGSAIVLASFRWWAPIVLAMPMVLWHRWVHREHTTFQTSFDQSTPELRRAAYVRDLAVRPDAAKEIRVFGLAGWLVDRYTSGWTAAMKPLWDARRGHAGPFVQVVVAELLAGAAVFATLGQQAFAGAISIGALAVYAGAAAGIHGLGPTADYEIHVLRGNRAVVRLRQLRERTRTPAARLSGTSAAVASGPIRFEDVTFVYPGSSRQILDGLSLEIDPGRSLAIVGLNGAGKTTLMKLLARLYDPVSGRITVDGTDIATIDPRHWRSRVGVIFQDFVRFELDARANVGFGALDLIGRDDVLERAAARAGATSILDQLPARWDTVLSRGYDGGTDLSGGQWQRVALARAFMALEGGADILVLDEPTANLDVRAEAELFDRFLEITRGVTTILISHRFSTVRHADRIAVVENGRVVEAGTHDALIAAGGSYAHLFKLQADRFAAGDEEPADA